MHFDQGQPLFFYECLFWTEKRLGYRGMSSFIKYLPDSLLIPSLPAKTHEAAHIEHTSRSLPSLIHPHLAAATASIGAGLLAYVESLNVESLERNDGRDEGRYSADRVFSFTEVARRDVKVSAFLARVAARDKIAVRCGVGLDRVPMVWVGGALDTCAGLAKTGYDLKRTDEDEVVLIPYFVRIE